MPHYAILLAAGKGTRMRSKRPKVLHPLCGKPMLEHLLDALDELELDRKITVIGHGAEEVQQYLEGRTEWVLQEEQLGTAHAVATAAPLLGHERGYTLVLNADTPLLTAETLQQLLDLSQKSGAAVTLLTAVMDNPKGYGRILRSPEGQIRGIVEEKDATPEERQIREVNTGIYCFDNQLLFSYLPRVGNQNAQQEYYLPDVIPLLLQDGHRVETVEVQDVSEAWGINDRVALAQAQSILQERILQEHMLSGVTILDPKSTYIDKGVTIGRDTIIYPGSMLRGNTHIGEDCIIGPQAHLVDVRVEEGVVIQHSVVLKSEILSGSRIGPFAYIRPGCVVGPGAKVGDFVELKNTRMGEGSKASHLAYLGDAEIGAGVNIGCGAITVNYDGVEKHRTVIEDEAFIGCNVNLVAPVRVGKGAYVAAGSTITRDVPEEALAIARERQTNKEGYARHFRKNGSRE